MKSFSLRSPAKVNLWLEILDKRKDGYHNLESIIDTVSLYDRIIFEESSGGIEVSADKLRIPQEDNLAYQAAILLKSEAKIKNGAKISIEKHIPLSAGLGGGSSDAATTLLGLNKLWRVNLADEKLINLAAKLGSDVPFFIKKGRCLVHGKGEILSSLSSSPKIWYVIVVPKILVSTGIIYRQLKVDLTQRENSIKILVALNQGNLEKIGKELFNRLEEVSLRKYPEIRSFKENLKEAGALGVLMSGSGSAIFGIARTKEDAFLIASRIKKAKVFVVESQQSRTS